MLAGNLCRSSLSSLGLSLTLLGACSASDRPGRVGEPDWTEELPDAGDAGRAVDAGGIPDHYRYTEFDFIGTGQFLTPEMMCEAPEAGLSVDTFTHICNWSLPRRLTDRPGRQDRDPALVATGDSDRPVGLSWTGDEQIYFQILDRQGAAMTNEVQVSSAVAAENSRLAYDGSNFGVVWSDRADPSRNVPTKVDFRLVDGQGIPGAEVTLVDANARADKAVVSAIDSGWLVLWGDGRSGGEGIYGSTLTPQGSVLLAEQALTLSGAVSTFPSSTWTGSEIGAAWHDNRDGNPEIYFGRFDSNLELIESSGQAITQREGVSSEPTVINTDEGFAISWLDTLCGSIRAHLALLDAEGRWRAPEQIFPRENASAVSLAWDENHAALGVLYVVGDVTARDMYFQLLDSLGNRISEEIQVATGIIGSSENPQLIWTSEGFMTAYEDTPGMDREVYVTIGNCTEL